MWSVLFKNILSGVKRYKEKKRIKKLMKIRKDLFGSDEKYSKPREKIRQISLKELGREKSSSLSKRRKLKNYLDE